MKGHPNHEYYMLFLETEKHLWYLSNTKKLLKKKKLDPHGRESKQVKITEKERSMINIEKIWQSKFGSFQKDKIKWHDFKFGRKSN
jgi:hypothetical protein